MGTRVVVNLNADGSVKDINIDTVGVSAPGGEAVLKKHDGTIAFVPVLNSSEVDKVFADVEAIRKGKLNHN